jgi:hypothetical protein
MQIQELKQKLKSTIQPSETWLENQYPANPNERYSKYTFNNYQNITDIFNEDASKSLKEYLEKHPEKKIVVLARLTSKERLNKTPLLLDEPDSLYYDQYELFACAFHLTGFIEVFQNIKEGSQ